MQSLINLHFFDKTEKAGFAIIKNAAYIDAMKAEIIRVEALIAQKNKVQSAAAALFGGVAP